MQASRVIAAPAADIFELIADPARQPSWDGNHNLAAAAEGQRVHGVGDVFVTTVHTGTDRENHVVEFAEGRLIAWRPAEVGQAPARASLALGARADRRGAHPGHPHLRLDPAHRQQPRQARPQHQFRTAACVARPARGGRHGRLTTGCRSARFVPAG